MEGTEFSTRLRFFYNYIQLCFFQLKLLLASCHWCKTPADYFIIKYRGWWTRTQGRLDLNFCCMIWIWNFHLINSIRSILSKSTGRSVFLSGVLVELSRDVLSWLVCCVWEINLIWMCDDEGPLLRKVVIKVWDDLDGNICFSSTWWSYNLERWREIQEGVQRRNTRKNKNSLQITQVSHTFCGCAQSHRCFKSLSRMSMYANIHWHIQFLINVSKASYYRLCHNQLKSANVIPFYFHS